MRIVATFMRPGGVGIKELALDVFAFSSAGIIDLARMLGEREGWAVQLSIREKEGWARAEEDEGDILRDWLSENTTVPWVKILFWDDFWVVGALGERSHLRGRFPRNWPNGIANGQILNHVNTALLAL